MYKFKKKYLKKNDNIKTFNLCFYYFQAILTKMYTGDGRGGEKSS